MDINMTVDHLIELENEELRVWLWFKLTAITKTIDVSYGEIAGELQIISSKTVQRSIVNLVKKGYLEVEYNPGYTPTYTVVK